MVIAASGPLGGSMGPTTQSPTEGRSVGMVEGWRRRPLSRVGQGPAAVITVVPPAEAVMTRPGRASPEASAAMASAKASAR